MIFNKLMQSYRAGERTALHIYNEISKLKDEVASIGVD